MSEHRTVPGWLALVVAVAAVAHIARSSAWAETLARPAEMVTSDFQILFAAGQGLAEGQDIHDPEVLDVIGRRYGRPTTPFCAAHPLVIRAFGTFEGGDMLSAYRTWLRIHGGIGFAAIMLLALSLVSLGRPFTLSLAVALAAVGLADGTWMSLAMNSTNLLTLAALAGALLAACHRSVVLEGLLLAVAIVAKTSPALLLVVFVFAGRRRPLVATLAALLVLGAVSVAWSGWDVHASWVGDVLPVLGYAPDVDAGRFNNSLHSWNIAPNGLLSRAVYEGDAPRVMALGAAWLVTALVLVQLFASVRKRAGTAAWRADLRMREYALGVAGTLLVSSVTWPHHLALVALPACWLAAGRGLRVPARLVGLLACVVLYLPLGALSDDPLQVLDIGAKVGAAVVLFAALAVPLAVARAAPGPDALGADPGAAP